VQTKQQQGNEALTKKTVSPTIFHLRYSTDKKMGEQTGMPSAKRRCGGVINNPESIYCRHKKTGQCPAWLLTNAHYI
jgi:hypothetical protein